MRSHQLQVVVVSAGFYVDLLDDRFELVQDEGVQWLLSVIGHTASGVRQFAAYKRRPR
jgi:hypothetical protein